MNRIVPLVLALLAAIAAAGLACAVSLALVADTGKVPPRFVADATSKRAAHRDIERRLGSIRAPDWARTVAAGSRLTAPRLRGRYAFIAPAASTFWESRFLYFPASIAKTIRWLAQHPPGGGKLTYREVGPYGDDVKWYRCLWFEWPNGRPAIDERVLTLCAVEAHGGTSVRADVQTVWLEGRNPLERIPGGSRFLRLTFREATDDSHSIVIADRDVVTHTVALINSLPVTQHRSFTCPHGIEGQPPHHPEVAIVFRSRRGGKQIARLRQSLPVESGCRTGHLSIAGREERTLDEGWVVLRYLDPYLAKLRP